MGRTLITKRRLSKQKLKILKAKVKVLQNLVSANTLDEYPKRASVASFAKWTNESLGVVELPRGWIYQLEARNEHDQIVSLLDNISKRRKHRHKTSSRASERTSLKAAEERAQHYVNQYSLARQQLVNAQGEIDRLNLRLKRCLERSRNVTSLSVVKRKKTKHNV